MSRAWKSEWGERKADFKRGSRSHNAKFKTRVLNPSRSTSAQTETENAEDRTLREFFTFEKMRALKTRLQLELLVAEIQLDENFDEAETISALRLVRKLYTQLVTLGFLTLIVAIRAGIVPRPKTQFLT